MGKVRVIELGNAENWRQYVWSNNGQTYAYRIERPRTIYVGGSTHRVTDWSGITHIVPAIGVMGCVIRFDGKVVE